MFIGITPTAVFYRLHDQTGSADAFVETWHDDGPTDMLAAMSAYEDHVADDVPMRPDHVPTMAGEDKSGERSQRFQLRSRWVDN